MATNPTRNLIPATAASAWMVARGFSARTRAAINRAAKERRLKPAATVTGGKYKFYFFTGRELRRYAVKSEKYSANRRNA